MRSIPDRHSIAGPTLFGVDTSNLSMDRIPISSHYQVYTSADGAKPPLRSDCEPNSAAGIPRSEAQLRSWDPPLRDLNRHSAMGFTPARSRRILSVDGPHPHFRPLFTGKYFGEPVIARNIWYIDDGFLIWIILSTY